MARLGAQAAHNLVGGGVVDENGRCTVLQTGSSNLTLADSNEEATNSQALSTRQSSRCPRWRWPTRASRACLQLLR